MKCEICGREGAEYICRVCNRVVCRRCYLPEEGLCLQCARRQRLLSGPLGNPFGLMKVGMLLVFVGFFLIFLASILSLQSGGWTIILFPFIFTSGGGWLVAIIMLIFFLLMILPWFLGMRWSEGWEAEE
ncbi:hypothetical protein DRO56_01505 [Candidatus Bathyarchaeota archaeon]|nr:MAG: hypothetical protein DRO56_01505 [Candidatus Bathyarchaeota archaeon]